MKRLAGNIVLCLLVLLLTACQHRAERIPREDMVEIYSEMFMRDQIIRTSAEYRKVADTSLVYEGIFRAHGYTTDDFLYSVRYYLRDPNRMAKIMEEVSARMNRIARSLEDEVNEYDQQRLLLAIFNKPVNTSLPRNTWIEDRMNLEQDPTKKAFVRYKEVKPVVPVKVPFNV